MNKKKKKSCAQPRFMKQMNALVECHGIMAGNEFVIHDIVKHAVLLLVKDSLRLYPSIQLCLWQMICLVCLIIFSSFSSAMIDHFEIKYAMSLYFLCMFVFVYKLTLQQVKWTTRTCRRYFALNKSYQEWFQRCVRLDIIEESFAPKFDVLSESLVDKLKSYVKEKGGSIDDDDDDDKEDKDKASQKKKKREKNEDENDSNDKNNAENGNDDDEWKHFDANDDDNDRATSKKNKKSSEREKKKNIQISDINELVDFTGADDEPKNKATENKKKNVTERKENDFLGDFFSSNTTQGGEATAFNNSKAFENDDNWFDSVQTNAPAKTTASNATFDWLSGPQPTTQQPYTNNFNTQNSYNFASVNTIFFFLNVYLPYINITSFFALTF
ncbi:hypothetical protein RFI_28071 [Reticulomyxa filosa]|uniref:Uncharacterized protein n=1 Tax=Reticulomyxa filosa TaxID=46433 RepID=X6M5P5_RETFI|nr:hypothetical protein RFI_28071 [Reticulomyxa filosa]|eukprot:ETO09313.1 hypothetical protein RFI_28071 [Reticulomyxa filosa]